MKKPEIMMELLHYVVVFGALCLAWVPLMNYFKTVELTAAAGLVVFFIADQVAHKFMLGEKFIWE